MIGIRAYQLQKQGEINILAFFTYLDSDDWTVLPHEGQTFLMCSTDSHANLLQNAQHMCARTHAHTHTALPAI